MISPLSNPVYLVPPLVAALATIVMVLLVWRKSRRDFSSRLFYALLLSMMLYGLMTFMMRSSPDVHKAILWDRVIPPAGFAIFVFYYHFSLTYTGNKHQRGFLLVSYLVLVIAAGLIPTRLIVDSMVLQHYGYAPIPGPLAYPLTIGVLLMGAATYNMLRRYKASHSYEERNRLLYLSIAPLFPLVGGLLDGFSGLLPLAIWGNLIFCIICSIAILRYHLLDIRIIIRKSLVYLLVSAVVAIPYVAILYLLQHFIEPTLKQWWIHAFIILIWAILLRPLYSRAQDWVDRLFYRGRYDYLKALERFSRETQSITNLKELGVSMVQVVGGALRASNVCLLLMFEDKHGLVMVASTGLERPASGVMLSNSSPFKKWLDLHGDIVTSEQLSIIPQLQSFSRKEMNSLKQMRAELYVPMKTRQGQLAAILTLGPKLSQQPYSNEERQLLATLCSQMAMVLENARLYDSEKATRIELEKLNEQKTEFLHSVAHELKTPLTAVISSSEILSEDSKTSNKIRERLISNIRTSAESMNRRVTELINLAQMQVGEMKAELAPLEIGRAISEIASQLEVLFKTKEQILTLEIPDLLSRMNADRGKLEQVLFNLLSNANKFSPIGSHIILRAREVGRKIIVEVEDSAPVVTEREKTRLFDAYYRGDNIGKRGQFPGLGLGLAISKKLVELHGGEIWVESKPRKGNIFAFSLPALDKRTNGIK